MRGWLGASVREDQPAPLLQNQLLCGGLPDHLTLTCDLVCVCLLGVLLAVCFVCMLQCVLSVCVVCVYCLCVLYAVCVC